jgi:hypothetical protein
MLNILQKFLTYTTIQGRKALPWHEHGLGLQLPQGPRLDAQLHPQGPCAIPAPSTQLTTASTIPSCQTQLWSKGAVCKDTDMLTLLPKEDKQFIQEVIGIFLYYAQYVDSTMLAALGSIATQQANPTEKTMKKYDNFWTMPLLILMQSSHTMQVTRSLRVTAMHHTSQNQRHAAGQVDISSCPTTPPNHQTMAPSSQLHKLSKQSCPQRQRLRWELST